MNNDQFKGAWKQLKGTIRTEFGKLTDDDVEEVEGRKTHLIGKLQERYGDAREKATERVNAWLKRIDEAV